MSVDIYDTNLKGVHFLKMNVFCDYREFFVERFNKDTFSELGIDLHFVQDNHSKSYFLRGLHAQPLQSKLVSVFSGEIFDVIVDLRKEFITYRKYYSIKLSENDFNSVLIPDGCLHGFQVISKVADVFYKVNSYYDPITQFGVIWNYENLAIKWPIENPILSYKDKQLPTLKELRYG